jgi:hypothetical protein
VTFWVFHVSITKYDAMLRIGILSLHQLYIDSRPIQLIQICSIMSVDEELSIDVFSKVIISILFRTWICVFQKYFDTFSDIISTIINTIYQQKFEKQSLYEWILIVFVFDFSFDSIIVWEFVVRILCSNFTNFLLAINSQDYTCNVWRYCK